MCACVPEEGMETNYEEVKVKIQFRLTSSAWIRLGESDARQFIVSIFKTLQFGKKFPATVIPIAGAH